jgi:DNA-binding NtrC family response regulator
MGRVFDLLRRVAQSDANVLVEGESGTGKELIAHEIVRQGRGEKPLVIVDAARFRRRSSRASWLVT